MYHFNKFISVTFKNIEGLFYNLWDVKCPTDCRIKIYAESKKKSDVFFDIIEKWGFFKEI